MPCAKYIYLSVPVAVVAVVFAVFSGLAFSVAVSMVAGSGFGQIQLVIAFVDVVQLDDYMLIYFYVIIMSCEAY